MKRESVVEGGVVDTTTLCTCTALSYTLASSVACST
jgi:hypothetical protein